MKKTVAVVLALLVMLFSAVPAFAADSQSITQRQRSIPNVMVADEFRTSDTAAYTEAQGEKIITLDLVSDTHIGSKNASAYVRPSIANIDREKDEIDGVIVSGDLTHSGYDSEFSDVYSILKTYTGGNMITANGNHDYGRWAKSGEMRPYAIKHRNEFMGIDTQKDYYSTEINGYKFVVMGSEGNKPNSAYISDEQLAFVKAEVQEGSQGGRPVFVICHWPMRNTHGERWSWPIIPGGALDSSTTKKLQNNLSQFNNVFYISGHLHAGLNGRLTRRIFSACCVEQHSGITCINVPSLGQGNHLGLTSRGTGMRLTVYSDKAVVEGRNFYTGEWLDNYVYEVSLKNAQAAAPLEDMPAMLPETPALPGDEEAA
ncbi:MAG: metallophosphoesterase [Clostridia bacterium]|nr:metallophosphoesterase [Clostridia bacterium]